MDSKSIKLTGLKAGADDGLEDGQFLAYASTWTKEPDSYGDIVAKGAFGETLGEWAKSGNTLPILYGHDMQDPFSNLGGAVELAEDDHGLLVKGQLDLENPKAMQVYRMLKGRRINQLSFAYDVLESGDVEVPKADTGDKIVARELRKMKLYEISIVPVGANQDTEVLAVKANADALKAGRSISTKNLEQLKAARSAIDSVITASEADVPNDDTPKASQLEVDAEAQERKASADHARSVTAVTVANISAILAGN